MFEDKDFKKLKHAKEQTGLTWEGWMLEQVKGGLEKR